MAPARCSRMTRARLRPLSRRHCGLRSPRPRAPPRDTATRRTSRRWTPRPGSGTRFLEPAEELLPLRERDGHGVEALERLARRAPHVLASRRIVAERHDLPREPARIAGLHA